MRVVIENIMMTSVIVIESTTGWLGNVSNLLYAYNLEQGSSLSL